MFIKHFCHTLTSGAKQDLNVTLEDLSEPLEDQIKTFEDLSEASELFGNTRTSYLVSHILFIAT